MLRPSWTIVAVGTAISALAEAEAETEAVAAAPCPAGTTNMGAARGGAFTVCEDLANRAGHVIFVSLNGTTIRLNKTAEHMYVDEASLYCGFNKTQVAASILQRAKPNGTAGSDILGDKILSDARAKFADPTLAAVSAALAPMVYNGGTNLDDPAHGGRGKSGGNQHTFVGSRSSSVNTVYDTVGSTMAGSMSSPTMNQYPGKYHRTTAVFKDRYDANGTLEGLWGDYLMAVSFHYPLVGGPTPSPPGGQCTTIPQPCPSHPGRTFCVSDKEPGQCDKPSVKTCPPCPPPATHCVPPAKPCTHHPTRCCGGPPAPPNYAVSLENGSKTAAAGEHGWIEWTAVAVPDMAGSWEQDVLYRVLKTSPNASLDDVRYFDTYAYRGPSDVAGQPAMGQPAGSRVATMFYDTLLDQHEYWERTFKDEGIMKLQLPRRNDTDGQLLVHQSKHSIARSMISRHRTWFPTYGVMHYGENAYNGAEWTIVGDLAMALNYGAFEYAKGILRNWLQYYVRYDGFRFAETSQANSARELTLFAQYYHFTGDPDQILLIYHEKVRYMVKQMYTMRNKGLTLPKTHPAYGMPVGNDLDDTTGVSITCGTTYYEKGDFDTESRAKDCTASYPFVSIAAEMERAFRDLGAVWVGMGKAHGRPDIATNGTALLKEAEALHTDLINSMENSETIDPMVGTRCNPYIAGFGSCQLSPATKKPGFTYPTLDIFYANWDYTYWSGVLPEKYFNQTWNWYVPTILAQPGAIQGTAAGLLQHDRIEELLLHFYSASAHVMTRGTWTAAEMSGWDRTLTSSGYTQHCQDVVPTILKWLLAWEDTSERGGTLWLGKGLPRVWLSAGETVVAEDVPTRAGRIGLKIVANVDSYAVNLTLPSPYEWPTGGVRLRLRSPAYPKRHIASATVGGKAWAPSLINTTEETIVMPNSVAQVSLQNIIVKLS